MYMFVHAKEYNIRSQVIPLFYAETTVDMDKLHLVVGSALELGVILL